MLKKFVNEIHALAWTISGSGIVLITLSGQTRTWGIWITLSSFGVHMLGVMFKKEESK